MQELTLRRAPDYSMSLLPSTNEWNTLVQIAETVVKSGLAPSGVNSAQKALIIMLKARELSIPPMQALQTIHVVEGKPTLSADIMVAILRRAGHKVWAVETNEKRCVLKAHRKNEPEHTVEVTYTIEDAKTAGKAGSGTWAKYPAQMLYARCASRICRMVAPDELAGMYTAEELGAEVRLTEDGQEEIVEISATEVKPAEPVQLYPAKKAEPTTATPAKQATRPQQAEGETLAISKLPDLKAEEFKHWLTEMNVTVEQIAGALSGGKEKSFNCWAKAFKAANPDADVKNWYRFGLHQFIKWAEKNKPQLGFIWDEKNQLPIALEDVPFEETPEEQPSAEGIPF